MWPLLKLAMQTCNLFPEGGETVKQCEVVGGMGAGGAGGGRVWLGWYAGVVGGGRQCDR